MVEMITPMALNQGFVEGSAGKNTNKQQRSRRTRLSQDLSGALLRTAGKKDRSRRRIIGVKRFDSGH